MKSAMMFAARQEMGHKSTKFDVARAAAVIGTDHWDSLKKAIMNHDVQVALGIFTVSGMSINAQDADGKTALMHAVEVGNHAMTQELVNRGASIDIQDAAGRTAFDFALPGATTTAERDAHMESSRHASVPPQVLVAMTQALYACARNRPTDETPCQFVAKYLREYNASRFPVTGLLLPHKDLASSDEAAMHKPLGVSSNELNIALEYFRKFDVDNTGTLEVEECVLLVMRMAHQIAGRLVPDQTILRAVKTLLSDTSPDDCALRREELANGLDRICPVFRSFRSQLSGLKAEINENAVKPVTQVVDDLYADFDLNSDGILMPDEITLLLRRVADASGMDISDTQVIELFRLMMNHSMQDKDADGVLTKDEVKAAMVLVTDFYHENIVKKYGSATHQGTALRW